jgi:putative phage-type endonuclease
MREENPLQGTAAWHSARCGKLTASRMEAAMSFLKNGKESSKRIDLKKEILAERMTDQIVPKYTNSIMQHGIDTEPAAKMAFEAETGLLISDVGFIDHPEIEFCGCSPDGLVSDGSLIEIKCPQTSTHLSWIISGQVPEEHKPQMILQCICTGKSSVWFVSYDPRITKGAKQLYIRKFEPTEKEIQEVEEAAQKFLSEVDEMFDLITIGD